MASALVNKVGLVAPEGFLDLPPSAAAYSSYGWLSPRISFSRDFDGDGDGGKHQDADGKPPPPPSRAVAAAAEADLGSPGRDLVGDFEFRRLDDPVTMLPADELFSDGKLVPLQLAPARAPFSSPAAAFPAGGIRSSEPHKLRRRSEDAGSSDPYTVFSPKAPRCSSRWRELLGLKKAAQSSGGGSKPDSHKPSSSTSPMSSSSSSAVAAGSKSAAASAAARSLKHLLHRNHTRSSASIDASLSLPLLRDSDSESVSISARLSLSSSSSSGPDHEDLPRLSLDSDKPSQASSISLGRNPPRVRLTPKPRPGVDHSSRPYQALVDHPPHHSTAATAAGGRVGRSPMRRAPGDSAAVPARGASVDSPRMNSSGKVVFQSLERSSSSPSTFNGGPRVKHRGMERSYSANVVRVTPVLNVPVCSLRGSSKSGSVFGFGQLFSSPHKKDGAPSSSAAAARNSSSGRGGKTVRA
uniref:Uncharacterized protein n=1 Tax=Anthurium amnicola TaxID=1678845 RepID=A0A1D1YPT5_9ARAE